MARENFYTAVDIGTNKVCAILARVGSEGELKILGTGIAVSQGVQKGRIESIKEVKAAVAASLEEAQRYVGRDVVSGVYATISGTHISCLNTQDELRGFEDLDGVTSQQLHQLIQSSFPHVDATQEVLHVIPIGYEVDGLSGVRNPTGLHASKVQIESHVVLGDATTIKNTVKAIEVGKVSVNSLVLQSLASAEATLTGDEREMGVVLADIGAGTCDVSIYRDGHPWYSTVLPVGGSQLTRDLAVALRVPYHMAEEIKVKWGNVMPESIRADEEVVIPGVQGQPKRVVKRRGLCEPLHLRMIEMLKLIMLRVSQAGLRQLPTGGLVITGGSAEIAGLKQLVESNMGGQVRIAYPNGIAGLPSQLRKPAFSAGVGALLWGIKHQGERRTYQNGERTLWGYKSLARRFGRSREQVTR
ncbi:MAG TPA: cell division protein FtsA [Dehalococcoidia bacterium]|nr:cell division protein FtsA [Dehalococcoidia bacterium]